MGSPSLDMKILPVLSHHPLAFNEIRIVAGAVCHEDVPFVLKGRLLTLTLLAGVGQKPSLSQPEQTVLDLFHVDDRVAHLPSPSTKC